MGLLPRTLRVLFEALAGEPDRRAAVWVAAVEVYGEQVYDFLGGGWRASPPQAPPPPRDRHPRRYRRRQQGRALLPQELAAG